LVYIGRLSKDEIIKNFAANVSSGKVDFYTAIGFDFIMGRREGPWVWDISGEKKLINCHCNGGVFNLGHRHPAVLNVLREALEELDIGNHHLISEQRAILADKLAELSPEEITRVVFGVGGGEAVDFAIKLARGYTGRHKIIYGKGGYHGHTGLALAAGDDHFKAPFEPLAPGFVSVPFGDADSVERAVDEKTAAVLFETIPATLGMPLPPNDFYEKVREICDRKGVLLILDEIQTGLGRTGRLWGFEHYDVVPDIFVIGKGLSGGVYPISATCYKEELDSFMRKNPFIHVSTFGGAELGCPVALEVLEIVSSEMFLEHVKDVANFLGEKLESLRKRYSDILVEIRQKGLFMGLKMSDVGYGPVMSIASYNNGILAIYADNDSSVLQFLPPLIIDKSEASYILERLDEAYKWAKEHPEYLELAREVIH